MRTLTEMVLSLSVSASPAERVRTQQRGVA